MKSEGHTEPAPPFADAEKVGRGSHWILELMKGLVLWKDTGRISMIWGNWSLSQRGFNEDPVMMMVYQKLVAVNQTGDSLQ